MMAVLPGSRSRRIRSPRLVKPDIDPCGLAFRWRRRRCVVSPASAREQLALGVEYLGLGGRELAAHANDLALDGEVAGHRHAVIVDPYVDGRHAAPELL